MNFSLELTDVGNAKRLANASVNELLYDLDAGSWMRWSGTHWTRHKVAAHAQTCALDMIRAMRATAAGLTGEEQKAWRQHVKQSQGEGKIAAMLRLARADLGVTAAEMNNDPWLFNCANGTLDLRTANLSDHRPHDRHTRVSLVPYLPDATCPIFMRFIREVFAEDQDLIAYVQKVVGLMLTGDVSEQKMWLAHGDGGNGKSTFVEVLQYILGPYSTTLATESLLATRHGRSAGAPTPDLMPLVGARLCVSSEAGPGRGFDLGLVKRLTGGDDIPVRQLYTDPTIFKPTSKLLILTNSLPAISDHDHAIWRRIIVLPFSVRIPSSEVIKDLGAQLRAESEGILAWAVEGCLAWQREGLEPPDAVVEASGMYRAQQDPLGRFLQEECVVDPNGKAEAKALYDAYARWASREDEPSMSIVALGRELSRRGYPTTRTGARRLRQGLLLRAQS